MVDEPNDSERPYEEVRAWPVKIRVGGKQGFSIWAHHREDDFLITVGGYLTLFKTTDTMVSFLRDPRPHRLSSTSSYVALARWIVERGGVPPEDVDLCDLDWVRRRFASGAEDRWTSHMRARLLNDLNMAWDIGRSLGDRGITAAMRSRQPLGRFMDRLTDGDVTYSRPLAGPTQIEIIQSMDIVLTRTETRTLLVC